jgi:hypothetical protein
MWKIAVDFPRWQSDTADVFIRHSAKSAKCLGLRCECDRGESFVVLCGPCCRFQSSSYLLKAVSIIFENSG